MAISTIRGIWVSIKGGLTVDALGVTLIGMTDFARLDHPLFVPLPCGQFMDICVAVYTSNFIAEMDTCIKPFRFFFMTSMAFHWFGMDSSPFRFRCFHMSFDVGDIQVTTDARIVSMNGLSKFLLTDFIPVAIKTF
jgi:hypothetical protein